MGPKRSWESSSGGGNSDGEGSVAPMVPGSPPGISRAAGALGEEELFADAFADVPATQPDPDEDTFVINLNGAIDAVCADKGDSLNEQQGTDLLDGSTSLADPYTSV